MIRSYEDFTEELLLWANVELREKLDREEVRKLWEILGMHDLTERLYLLQKDDACGVAEEMGIDLNALEKGGKLPEHFWEDVQKGVESGLGCWSEVLQTALEEALSATGIERKQLGRESIGEGSPGYAITRRIAR